MAEITKARLMVADSMGYMKDLDKRGPLAPQLALAFQFPGQEQEQ